jgi:hypothetical protein
MTGRFLRRLTLLTIAMRDGIFKYKIRMPTILRLVDAAYITTTLETLGPSSFAYREQELAEKLQSLGPDYAGGEHHRTRFCQQCWPLKASETRKFLMDQSNLQAWAA